MCSIMEYTKKFAVNFLWQLNCILPTVLSCTLLLVFSGLNCHISVTQSPKYAQLKRITNQFSFVYTVVKSLYIDGSRAVVVWILAKVLLYLWNLVSLLFLLCLAKEDVFTRPPLLWVHLSPLIFIIMIFVIRYFPRFAG